MKKKQQQIGGAAHLSVRGIPGITKLESGDRISVVIQGKSKRQTKAPKAIALSFWRIVPERGTEPLLFSQLLSLVTDGTPGAGREGDKFFLPFDEPLAITDLISMATGMELAPLTMSRPLTHLYELRGEGTVEPITALRAGDTVSFWGFGEQLAVRLPRSFEASSEPHDVVFPAKYGDAPAVLDLLAAITGLLLVQRTSSPTTYDCRERKPD